MSQSQTILHLMGMDSTKYGGIERFNVELASQLNSMGYHSVFVYESFPQVEQFVKDLSIEKAEIVVLNSRNNPLRFCCQLWTLFKKYDFCMMHAHFTKARFYAVPLARLYGIHKIVYTFHSSLQVLPKIKLHTRLWYRVCNRFSRIVAVSKDIENTVRSNWPQTTVKKLYLGIKPVHGDKASCRSKLGIPTDMTMIMCTANFNHVKGLDILVKAAHLIKNTHTLRNTIFYIVGQPDSDKQELQKMIDDMALTNYFRLEGISNAVPQYLCAADIYVQPSRSEGLPIALMEACSVGLPIVASRVGGVPEVAVEDENALLFEQGNSAEFAEKLWRLIENKDKRHTFGNSGLRIYKEKFAIENNAARLIEYYEL